MLRLRSALPVSFVLGDTAVQPVAVVTADEDPGNVESVALELWRFGATEPDVFDAEAEQSDDGLLLTLTGALAETDVLVPGLHFARFVVELPSEVRVTLPPDDRLRVYVYGPAVEVVGP